MESVNIDKKRKASLKAFSLLMNDGCYLSICHVQQIGYPYLHLHTYLAS